MNDAADLRHLEAAARTADAQKSLATLATMDSGAGAQAAESRAQGARTDFERAMLGALTRRPRTISPKYFYDRAGSELFEAICKLPEYYPTRTEIDILRTNAREIARWARRNSATVDALGIGRTITATRKAHDALDKTVAILPL